MSEQSAVTFLFTDIEGSIRLWEQEPERMPAAMERHDAISREIVERHRGTIVKMRGDGVHAAFGSSLDAILATIEIQQILQSTQISGVTLNLRCGLHTGTDERRDGDYYGRAVNRAARIASAAHGGQVLVSKEVANQIKEALPSGTVIEDLGAVRLRDLASVEHIYQLRHPQLRGDFPPLRSLDSTPNNLTEQLNPFIGRERELAEIKQKLASHRLVTLLGMGGMGKSRLSMQLAAKVLDDFVDGVWFVELAALTDESSVAQAVASVLGVKEEAGKPVIDALAKYVHERQLLIVLDNCEHVIGACAALAKRLLRSGAGLKMLVTSRDYLQIGGEATYQVPPLSVPNPRQGIDFAQLGQHEAIRLFLDRAAASLHGFGLSKQNAASIADICFCLDGIPLAIELAAARVRAISVQNIAARLSDRFRLLVTSDQTVLPRQKTLRALIDWSYDLLSGDERTAFMRLSVFAGGWTLEAAEAVCADQELRSDAFMDLMSSLIEKSLVVMELGAERYRMLDTVRHYAQEKFEATGNAISTRDKHLHFYVDFAEVARTGVLGPEQSAWLDRLDMERENLLLAHKWCDQSHDGSEQGLRLASALKHYWLHRGLLALGHQVSLEALSRINVQRRDVGRARALCELGQLCCFMGRYREALEHLQQSLGIARELGNESIVTAVLQPLSMATLALGDTAKSRRYCEEAIELAEARNDNRQLAAAINALAQLNRVEGSQEQAEALYARVVELSRALGDRESTAIGLLNQTMVAISRDWLDGAKPMLKEVYEIAKETKSQQIVQSALDASAGFAIRRQSWELGARLYGAAQSMASRTGIQRDAVDTAFIEPLIDLARKQIGSSNFAQALDAGQALSTEDAIAAGLQALNGARSEVPVNS